MRSSSPWGPTGPTQSSNRPEISNRIPKDVMFHSAGPTGWGRIRDLGGHKQGRSEHDFRAQHRRFFDLAVDELDEQE
jgi:hypothetical protein